MTGARIDLVAPPFAGHLHPILGVARRLAGDHDVRVLSTARAQAEIAASGLEGVALLAGSDEAIAAISDPPRPVGSNPLGLHRQVKANLALLDRFQAELRALWSARRPQLVLADFTVPVAGLVARELGAGWWTTHPSPCVIETPDGPPAYLGGWGPARGPLGSVRNAAGRQLVRAFKRLVHRLHRRQLTALGLPRIYRQDGTASEVRSKVRSKVPGTYPWWVPGTFRRVPGTYPGIGRHGTEAVYSDERILAFGLPQLEFPRRWPAAVELVGPVLYTPPSPLEHPAPMFRPGRPHVLVTLGTHLGSHKPAMAAAVRRASERLPAVDFHFTDGDSRSDHADARENFQRLGYVSYAEHLGRYDMVVHHGGAGVLYHTLHAGLPALVAPIDYDQPDHAARLVAAGLARHLRGRWRDGDELARQVEKALADPDLRASCCRFAALLVPGQAEDRVAALVADRPRRPSRARAGPG
jgi:UDP:flavonoid glycosyltransferase YjiC (YdhE family)